MCHNKIKYKAFGKVTYKNNDSNKELQSLYKQKMNTNDEEQKNELDEKIAHATLKKQTEKIESEISKLKSLPGGRIKRIFKVKEMLNGSKKQHPEKVAMKHFKTGELLVNDNEIKNGELD